MYFVEVQFQKDTRIYQCFFADVFLYFSRYDCANDWRGVVVFKKRSLDPGVPPQYQDLFVSQRVTQIYLDELGVTNQSIGVGVVRLVV
ncbi:hypothetical protein CSQ79_23595 [Gloeocapsopsis sp. IPPAS B-1203]|nr:hypothetical protein CSQ79_23595 [Gloeocapsopsis sp. IPPAS B-1203]